MRLQSHRLVDFVRERRHVLQRLTLTNSEGYWVRGPVLQHAAAQPCGLDGRQPCRIMQQTE